MLELVSVDYIYQGGIVALTGIDLAFGRGEKVALLGANGAGKTTALNLCNGTLRPSRGAVRLNGAPVTYDRNGLRTLRQAVGLVLQDPDDQLFAASVFEDVSFGPANLGIPEAEVRQRVETSLEIMRMRDLADRPTHMLSFGQRKRTAIAGALAMRPAYLLLDEPAAGLDPEGMMQLMEILDQVAADGTAIVMATHDMDAAYGWADRIVIFGRGTIAAAGGPESVFADQALLKELHLHPPLLWEVNRIVSDASGGAAPDEGRGREATLARLRAVLAAPKR